MKNNKKRKFIFIGLIILLICVLCVIILFFTKDRTISTVKLETQTNDIYEWEYKIDNKKIVKFVERKRSGDFDDKGSGIITEKYIFKALKPGKTTITFTFVNKNNKSFGEIKTYKAVVDKKLHLTINSMT